VQGSVIALCRWHRKAKAGSEWQQGRNSRERTLSNTAIF